VGYGQAKLGAPDERIRKELFSLDAMTGIALGSVLEKPADPRLTA